MNPDETAPKGAVWSGFILFANQATKVHKQKREQTTIAVNSEKRLTISCTTVGSQSDFDYFTAIFCKWGSVLSPSVEPAPVLSGHMLS